MVQYKCIQCNKVIKLEYIKSNIRCPYCGSKILFKANVVSSTFKSK
ncbi:MAG: DNA-directed RNA polymerase subunit P [Nanoarchaeota archaeon]|nr:DNA-directed RNA polymerase subunit P [Nanoarchaeota archaeon]